MTIKNNNCKVQLIKTSHFNFSLAELLCSINGMGKTTVKHKVKNKERLF